tara:strand:- start:97 stop:798 length:702 start_codon:yes stop_codon:yes gene_type:complete
MKNLNIIFVHGWLFDSKIWWGLDNEFNDFKSVCTIDLPGYGENKVSKINHIDFCKNLLRTIEERTIIIAWSYGASLILEAYHSLINPNIQIVLINANLKMHDSNNKELNINNINKLIINLEKDRKKTIKKFIYECVKNSIKPMDEFKKIINKFEIDNLPDNKILIQNLNDMKLFASSEHIALKNDNILCINADKDQFVDKRDNVYLEATIKGLGHIPFIHGNKQIFKLIMDFI